MAVHCKGSGPGCVDWFDGTPPTEPTDSWTIGTWIRPAAPITQRTLVAGFGDGLNLSGAERFFAADTEGWFFYIGEWQGWQVYGADSSTEPPSADALTSEEVGNGRLDSRQEILPEHWQYLAASYDGATLRFFLNGHEMATRAQPLARAAMQILVAPPPPWKDGACFDGSVAQFRIWNRCLSSNEIGELAAENNAFENLSFVSAPEGATPSRTGPWVGRRSRRLPQDPATLPSPVPQVEVKRLPKLGSQPSAKLQPDGNLILNCGWEIADAATLSASPETIASPGLDTRSWYDATVPGTVLTTLVQQGVYPDPLQGLNNLLIPDSLARKSWWYRTEFATPPDWRGRNVRLTFNGINYHADIWLNGRKLGSTTGAFIRGSYDVAMELAGDRKNVLAVRVWPQPHSGVAHDDSPRAGSGPNGTECVMDGPTFFCAERWGWIPTIRDRCTGVWQDVVLHPTGSVALGDPRVVTTLPKLPDLSVAEIRIETELRNLTDREQQITLTGSVAGATFALPVTLAPHEVTVAVAAPKNFPQLAIKNPRLWWPNGYGEPALHELILRVSDAVGHESDRLTMQVGLREITCAVQPQLVVLVNGRRIFCKGGNWGMDDAMKRVSTERLEPYVRLHRDANVTMIRNWCGQSTTEDLYRLCDKYGILVWSEFWMSTEGHDPQPIDAGVMLDNAADTVKRLRNHPSMAFWFGRNEGTPPPWVNPGLEKLINHLDGARSYFPCSNCAPVSGGGPYRYVDPKEYFSMPSKKPFNSELGMESMPTADAWRSALGTNNPWPANDAWYYHDERSGMRNSYDVAMTTNYGEPMDFEGYVRRAQMLNYVSWRAMVEAYDAKLWNPSSGMLFWMSHPSWPSIIYQIYSQDYDTNAAFFAVKKACEPIHIQWNCLDNSVAVINNRFEPLEKISATASIYDMSGKRLQHQTFTTNAIAEAATVVTGIDWPEAADSPVQFLKLKLRDEHGELLSDNFYWHAAKNEDLKSLQKLPETKLVGEVSFARANGEITATVRLKNPTEVVALMAHLTLRDAATGERVLPAYASDNYVSLLPGENKTIMIQCTERTDVKKMLVGVDGWNVASMQMK
ncbi:MAG TPA: LamG-like jellyroll fold domain-containing protein [Terracidiphilus sp.]|nr:LamG-like jellyroll fold domain-containing protein [Terracidiphilus sp.]